MAIEFYNTLTKKQELFTPLKSPAVKMYSCGPTVYNTAHIGNFRAFVFSDTLRRTLTYLGYSVTQVMNITDVDDKTILGAKKSNQSLMDFTEKYTTLFKKDLLKLNILTPHHQPKATDYVSEMIKMISVLLEKNIAYKTEDGIYFSISKAKDYGALAGLKIDHQIMSQSRIEGDEYEKDNPQDFALWKFYKEADGAVKWDAPFGAGRPGWHIECSAMSTSLLGNTIDIHTGGIDNIFPHHTNEIAQSESVTGQTFVKYWMHSGFVNMADEKMAKSIGNIITLETLSEKNIKPLAYRLWLLSAHYRTTVNFTWETIIGTQEAYTRLTRIVMDLKNEVSQENPIIKILNFFIKTKLSPTAIAYQDRFKKALSDDLNTPQAVALLWEIVGDQTLLPTDKLALILDFDEVLGLGLKDVKNDPIPANIKVIVEEREIARKAQNWAKSDELRASLASSGYEVLDTPEGQKIYKK